MSEKSIPAPYFLHELSLSAACSSSFILSSLHTSEQSFEQYQELELSQEKEDVDTLSDCVSKRKHADNVSSDDQGFDMSDSSESN